MSGAGPDSDYHPTVELIEVIEGFHLECVTKLAATANVNARDPLSITSAISKLLSFYNRTGAATTVISSATFDGGGDVPVEGNACPLKIQSEWLNSQPIFMKRTVS